VNVFQNVQKQAYFVSAQEDEQLLVEIHFYRCIASNDTYLAKYLYALFSNQTIFTVRKNNPLFRTWIAFLRKACIRL
jgi:hypothetical protein